jgi:flagellar capping protein FliD
MATSGTISSSGIGSGLNVSQIVTALMDAEKGPLNSINKSKTNLINDSDNPDVTEKEYNPWIVNKSLSYFADTVQFANIVNSIHSVDKKLQYDFLINIVRPKNRYSKWVKKEDSGDIDIVKEVYGYSSKKAEIALSLLSTEQIAALKRITNKGGLKK